MQNWKHRDVQPRLPGKGGVSWDLNSWPSEFRNNAPAPSTYSDFPPSCLSSLRGCGGKCTPSCPACRTWHSPQLWPLHGSLGCCRNLIAQLPQMAAQWDCAHCSGYWERSPASEESLCRSLVQDKAPWQAALANTAALQVRQHPRWPEYRYAEGMQGFCSLDQPAAVWRISEPVGISQRWIFHLGLGDLQQVT